MMLPGGNKRRNVGECICVKMRRMGTARRISFFQKKK